MFERVNYQLLSQGRKLAAGANLFKLGPERGLHWVVLQLTASYDDPEMAGGFLTFFYEKPQVQNNVTIVRHPTDRHSTFPLIGGSASSLASTYGLVGQQRPLYVASGDAMGVAYEGAVADRPAKISGLVLEAAADVDLTPWM